MKSKIQNIILLMMIGLSISVITSCNKDDKNIIETENETIDAIVGEWQINESNMEMTSGQEAYILFLTTTYDVSADSAQIILDLFMSDYFEIEQINGTITFNSDQTYQITSNDSNENGTWLKSIDGKMITISSEGEEDQLLNIRELTNTTLVLSILMESEYFDLDENGSEETLLEFEVVLHLSK